MLGADNYTRKTMSYESMVDEEIDLSDGGTYIVLSKGKIDGFDDNEDFFDLLAAAKEAKLFSGSIYVMAPSLAKKFEDNPDWSTAIDAFKSAAESKLKNPEVVRAMTVDAVISGMRHIGFYDFVNVNVPPLLLSLIGDHPVSTAIRGFHEVVAASKNITLANFLLVANHFDLKNVLSAPRDIVAEFKDIDAKYPLLSFAFATKPQSHAVSKACTAALDYIKLVDDAAKNIAKAA